jgi:hypothetical protein
MNIQVNASPEETMQRLKQFFGFEFPNNHNCEVEFNDYSIVAVDKFHWTPLWFIGNAVMTVLFAGLWIPIWIIAEVVKRKGSRPSVRVGVASLGDDSIVQISGRKKWSAELATFLSEAFGAQLPAEASHVSTYEQQKMYFGIAALCVGAVVFVIIGAI